MLVLVDECVPRSVSNVFVERNHSVLYVVEALTAGTVDQLVATYASLRHATVVTWDVRHYRPLLNKRHRRGELIYPNMGLIGFQCHELNGEVRLRAHIEIIEHEHLCVQGLADKRLRLIVSHDQLNILRSVFGFSGGAYHAIAGSGAGLDGASPPISAL